MLKYTRIPVGMLESNCYVLRDVASGALALVDCGFFNKAVAEAIEANGGDLRYLLLTHGHFDHIQGATAVKKAYPAAQVCISEADAPYLRGEIQSIPGRRSRHQCEMEPDKVLYDGDALPLGESTLRVIETPGHTPGGVCFYAEKEKLLFTGDTLFLEDVGRTDLPGGTWTVLQGSLRCLMALAGDAVVLPGHGPASSLEHERTHNPHIGR